MFKWLGVIAVISMLWLGKAQAGEFREAFEILYIEPDDGAKHLSTLTTFNIEFSIVLNGDRLSNEAFSLTTKDKTEIVPVQVFLYSTDPDNPLRTRGVRVFPTSKLRKNTKYVLTVKSDGHLVSNGWAGDRLDEDYIVNFETE